VVEAARIGGMKPYLSCWKQVDVRNATGGSLKEVEVEEEMMRIKEGCSQPLLYEATIERPNNNNKSRKENMYS